MVLSLPVDPSRRLPQYVQNTREPMTDILANKTAEYVWILKFNFGAKLPDNRPARDVQKLFCQLFTAKQFESSLALNL
jgi:hypothetical protein